MDEAEVGTIQLAGISGSLRRESYSTAVLLTLKDALTGRATVNILSPDLPLYNGDMDGEQRPDAVKNFQSSIASSDGLLIVSPEYNYGIPGVLKNALDWASRPANQAALKGKDALIITSSPGMLGGARAQAQIRQTLSATMTRVLVWPDVTIPRVKDKIVNGRLVDEGTLKIAGEALDALLREIQLRRKMAAQAS
ncbi:MAG TPA: NADPH-dependent FMN reductase [Terriglobales bacterium]|nr:NADPH-dependent FMN reductase [Terriglobales bacterium]